MGEPGGIMGFVWRVLFAGIVLVAALALFSP